MATSISKTHPTPNGGVRSRADFLDDDDNPVDQSKATKVIIIEYDAANNEVARTYGTLGGG